MTVDEQLRQAFDTLATRVREEAAAQLNATIAELSASMEADRARAVATAIDEARAAAEQEFAVSRAAAVTAAEARVRAELAASIEADRVRGEADRVRAVSEAVNEARIAAEQEFAASRTAAVTAAEARVRAELSASIDAERAHAETDRARAVLDAVNEARIAAEQEFAASRTAAVTAAEARVRTELSTSFEADRARAVADAVAQARIAAEEEFDSSRTSAVSEAEMRARAAVEAAAIEWNARLLDAVGAIDRARSLSEILDLLADSAAAEAARVAVLLKEGPLLRGWRLVGFEGLGGEADFTVSLAASGLIAEAIETRRVVRAGDEQGSAASRSVAPPFADLPADRPALAVPLVMGGQTFAILYADQSANESVVGRASWPVSLELLARHAARSLEAITASRLVEVSEVGTQWQLA